MTEFQIVPMVVMRFDAIETKLQSNLASSTIDLQQAFLVRTRESFLTFLGNKVLGFWLMSFQADVSEQYSFDCVCLIGCLGQISMYHTFLFNHYCTLFQPPSSIIPTLL